MKHNKTRTNSFVSSKRKTCSHPEILAPVSNEKHKFENLHVLKIKKTYDILMKKLISPNLDLKLKSDKIFEQIKNMDIKKQQEMFSSLLLTRCFDKTKNKKLPGAPFDEKCYAKEKIQHNNTKNFTTGWSGQATSSESLKPKIEVASKYPFDIDSAFFDFTHTKELDTMQSGKELNKTHKKMSQGIKNPITHQMNSINEIIPKKSDQLIKEIPKSRLRKFYRLNAARREGPLLQSELEPSQGFNISDAPAKNTIPDEIESKMQPICTDSTFNYDSGNKDQPIKDIRIMSTEKSEFQEEKELRNMSIEDNWEELPQKYPTPLYENQTVENHQDYKTLDKTFIPKQVYSNENMSSENIREEQNTDDSVFKKSNRSCVGIKSQQKNIDSTSEIPHQVVSTNNQICSKCPIFCNDKIDLEKGKHTEKNELNENSLNSSVKTGSKEHFNNKNTTDSTLLTDGDQMNQLANSNKSTKNEGNGFWEENLSFRTNKSMKPLDSTCGNSRQTKSGLTEIFENLNLNTVQINDFEKEVALKESSTSHKNSKYLNKQNGKSRRSRLMNKVVSNEISEMDHIDSCMNPFYSKKPIKNKKNKKLKTKNVYKKRINKTVGFTEVKVRNNKTKLTNANENFIPIKSQNNNKNNSRTELLKDFSFSSSVLGSKVCSPTKKAQNLNNTSTESFVIKTKNPSFLSSKLTSRTREDLSKTNSKIYMKKSAKNKSDTNRTLPYLPSLKEDNKVSSNQKNHGQSTMLSKTKHVEDSVNKSKVMNSTINTINKVKGVIKKPKLVVSAKSDYVKFVENKAWFSGSSPKKEISKADITTVNGSNKETPDERLKFSSFKLTDVHTHKKENLFTNRVLPENTHYNELKDIKANKEKPSYQLAKSKLDNIVTKIKTEIKDLESNKNYKLRAVKPLRTKIENNNVQQCINNLEQSKNNSIRQNVGKQTANKVDGKVTSIFDHARSNLIRRRELISNKTKPCVQLSKSQFEVSLPVISNENSYNEECLTKTKTGIKKDSTALYSVEDPAIRNILNYSTSDKGIKKKRKLHSKKLNPKHSNLKMYGEEKHSISIPDVCSLKSVQVVHKDDTNKTSRGLSLPSGKQERRKCLERIFRNKVLQSGNRIFPIPVQTRNLCTVQDTATMTVNSLWKRFSTTTTAVKNIENNYFGPKTTNNAFQRGEFKERAENVLVKNGNLKAFQTNVKRTMVSKGINNIQKPLAEAADCFKIKGRKVKNARMLLKQSSEGEIPVSAGKPLTLKKDKSLEVLYERKDIKGKDRAIQNLHQRNNKFHEKIIKHTSGNELKTCNSNNCSHIIHNLFKHNKSSKTKSGTLTKTNSIHFKELHNISLPSQISNHNLSTFKTVNNIPEKKVLKHNNKERIFEINNTDVLDITPSQLKSPTNLKNLQQTNSNGNEKIGHSLIDIREYSLDKSNPYKTENFTNNLFKVIKSQPNLKYTYLEPVSLSVLKPLKWRSKSDRLKDFQFRSHRSEDKNERKKTIIKPPKINDYKEFKNTHSVTFDNNENYLNKNNNHLLTNDTSFQTTKSKENQNIYAKSFLQYGKKQLDAYSYKSKTVEKTTNVGKQISNKDATLINVKQKAIIPTENKLVSKPTFGRSSLIRNSFQTHKSGIFRENLNLDKVELVKTPVSKSTLCQNKTTVVGNNLLDSSESNKLPTGKRNETAIKNEGPVDNHLKCQGKDSDKTNISKIKSNKYILDVQTVAKNNEKTNQILFNKDQKYEKEKPEVKLNESKKLQMKNNTKAIQNVGGINRSSIKTDKEPKTLATSFDLNFNLPMNIMSQMFKQVNDFRKEYERKTPDLTKTSIAMQYFNQLQLLKTATIPKRDIESKAIVENPEDIQHITSKGQSKLTNLLSFKSTLHHIPSKDKSKTIQDISKVSQHKQNISLKENDKLYKEVSGEPHSPHIPLLPLNIVNRKRHIKNEQSPVNKQEKRKTIKAIAVNGTHKKFVLKPPRLPVSQLSKHFQKPEKRLKSDGNKGDRLNKLEKQNKTNSFKIIKSIHVEPPKTTKEIKIADEKESKINIKKELITITGSNLSLHFDKLIKRKGRRDKFHNSRLIVNVNTKHEDKESLNKGQIQQVSKKSNNLIVSAKLGKNQASASNKCLEKIVDYGIEKNKSTLMHKNFITKLKMKHSSEKGIDNCKAKNKSLLANAANIKPKTQDESSSPVSLEVGTNNCSMSCEDVGKMKTIIRSANTFRICKGNKTMKKRQLQLIEKNNQIGQHLFKKEFNKKIQPKDQNMKTGAKMSKSPVNNCIYLSPTNPQSKGVYVLQIKPSEVKETSINSFPEVRKENSVLFNKTHFQYNNITNPKTN